MVPYYFELKWTVKISLFGLSKYLKGEELHPVNVNELQQPIVRPSTFPLSSWEICMPSTIPASWEICMHIRKQQLELDVEQQTGSI